MTTQPCGWTALDCTSPGEGYDAAVETAIFVLWSFTGQRYSQCEVTATPVPQCRCRRSGCVRECVLYLPGPVSEVLEVFVDGEAYDDWTLAVDGTLWSSTPWGDDVEVTYLQGYPPPPGADQAVAELAVEIAKARCNDSSCALPPNLVRRIREGDTVEFGKILPGTTGITTVDLWIDAANRVLPSRSVVSSPDVDPWVVQVAQVSP